MIGLDANILVRYFTQDDLAQAGLATEIIERRLSEDEPGFISTVAITETVWVLDRHYRFDRKRIATAIEFVLRTDALIVESEAEVFTALTALHEGRGQFADALIGASCAKAGCSCVLSFDAGAMRLPGFVHP